MKITKQQRAYRARLISCIKWDLAGYALGLLPFHDTTNSAATEPTIDDIVANLENALKALRRQPRLPGL
jgi:hypothetical protein